MIRRGLLRSGALATSLQSRDDDAPIEVLDAAYWMKGCSSLGYCAFRLCWGRRSEKSAIWRSWKPSPRRRGTLARRCQRDQARCRPVPNGSRNWNAIAPDAGSTVLALVIRCFAHRQPRSRLSGAMPKIRDASAGLCLGQTAGRNKWSESRFT